MKQAVVLIIDANSSMGESYDGESTRFDCAKRVAKDMISDLMIQGKTNIVGVVVLKSPKTHHHFCESPDPHEDIPFPNILELGGDGESTSLQTPTTTLLRRIHNLHFTENSVDLQGDFGDALIVAADSLYKQTNKKKYERRIVLITDAEHEVDFDEHQLQIVLESLRNMECPLNVVGLDFEQEATFDRPEPVPSNEEMRNDSDTDMEGEQDDEQENIRQIKSQNESLLISLTAQTGGYVMAAKEIKSVLQKVLGKKRTKAAGRKVEFEIAPTLSVNARYYKTISKATIPSPKEFVDDRKTGNGTGENLEESKMGSQKEEKMKPPKGMATYSKVVSYFSAENDQIEIDKIGEAYRYGNILVPTSAYDRNALSTISEQKIKILGYLPKSKVPIEFRKGPPYVLTGADSRKACAAISAIARSLCRENLVAIATFVKTKDASPSLAGIFPFEREGDQYMKEKGPIHLLVFQLPFRGDVAGLTRPPLPPPDHSKVQVCEDLIDALRLDDKDLDHTKIPNPLLRSYWKTVLARVYDVNQPVISVRSKDNDEMTTPAETLERAKPALKSFYDAFELAPRNFATQSSKKK